jgi:autotransporter-associated beta strand protein
MKRICPDGRASLPPRQSRSSLRGRGFIAPGALLALLLVTAPVGWLAAQPNASWSIQNTLSDYSVTSYAGTNPARGAYSYSVSGTTVQSYVSDLYENLDWSASGANAAIDYDIKSLSVGFDSSFFYFRTTVNGNINTGYYYFEIDSQAETDSPQRPDYYIQLQPNSGVLGSASWSNSNSDSLFTVWSDTNSGSSRAGGNNPLNPVYDQSGGTISGQSGGSYNNKLTLTGTSVYYRVSTVTNTATSDGYLDIAVRRSLVGLPSSATAAASVRATASQSSSLANDKMFIHDWFKPSDLSGMAFDNTSSSDISTWVRVGEAAGPVLAVPTLSGTTVSFGNFRVGSSLSQTLSLANTGSTTVDNRTQALTSTGSSSSGVSLSGLPTALAAGGTATLSIGLSSSSAGVRSGTIALTHSSVPGASATTGTTSVGSSTIVVSGTGWRAASGSTNNVFLGKFHVGTTGVSGTSPVFNTATADGFSESLGIVSGTVSGGNATLGTLPGLIAAGGAGSLPVGLSSITSVGTNSGTISIGIQSSGVGTSGLSPLSLGTSTVLVTAQGYSGQSSWISSGSNRWGSFENWDADGGTPGLDGSLSHLDTATFAETGTGSVTVNLDGAEPALASITFASPSVSYSISGSASERIRLGTPGAEGTLSSSSGNHSIGVELSLLRPAAVSTGVGSVLTIEGFVSGTGGFTKSGDGTLVLSGSNTYSGVTRVDGGLLVVNGDQRSATGAVTIESGGTLAGTGVIGGVTTLELGGRHRPGDTMGLQTFAESLSYLGGSRFDWSLASNTELSLDRGTQFSGVNLLNGRLNIDSGSVSGLLFNGPGSTVSWADGFWASDRRWPVYSNVTTPDFGSASVFDTILISSDSLGVELGDVRPDASFSWRLDGSDLFLEYTAVPEPSVAVLSCLGVLLPLMLRRRTA